MALMKKQVREWKKQKDQLGSLNSEKRRLDGGGCKAALSDNEEEFVTCIESLRARITCSNVQSKALKLTQARGDFCASDGWLQKFLKRHSFSLCRRTTVDQRLPQDLITKVVGFIMTTRKFHRSNNYPLSLISNMDETPLWLDMLGETTITRRGERSVPLRTTGHEKGRLTVVLSAMADGKKLKPYVVFKGVRGIPEMNTNGVVVALSKNGWINEELTKDWVKRVWGSLNFGRWLLVWDAYWCHITTEVRSCVNRQTNTAF